MSAYITVISEVLWIVPMSVTWDTGLRGRDMGEEECVRLPCIFLCKLLWMQSHFKLFWNKKYFVCLFSQWANLKNKAKHSGFYLASASPPTLLWGKAHATQAAAPRTGTCDKTEGPPANSQRGTEASVQQPSRHWILPTTCEWAKKQIPRQ